MQTIVYTDQRTYEEPIIEVADGSSEQEITEMIGHDDWDYAIGVAPTHTLEAEAGKQTEKPTGRIVAAVKA